VDFFLLLTITGAGDELQAVKRGVIELADAVVINKADGENRLPAEAARRQFETALHILRGSHDDATAPRALACSALTGDGVPEIWTMIDEHRRAARASGALDALRRSQALAWMQARVDEAWRRLFPSSPAVASERARLEEAVVRGELDAAIAAEQLMDFVASRGFHPR
jgi:LAO/AO transport system kinase